MNSPLDTAPLRLAKHIIDSDWGDPFVWQSLQAADVNYNDVLDRDIVIVMRRCLFYSDGTVELRDEGVNALLMYIPQPGSGHFVDFVAWEMTNPWCFGTLLGKISVLGHVDPLRNPIPIWKSPLRWLQEGCIGIVIIDPLRAPQLLHDPKFRFQCEDIEHAAWLADFGIVPLEQLYIPREVAA
jgi:hypothetical protein